MNHWFGSGLTTTKREGRGKLTSGDLATSRLALEIELNVHVLAEPRRIVVPVGLGVTKRLHQRVGLQKPLLDPGNLAGRAADCGDVPGEW